MVEEKEYSRIRVHYEKHKSWYKPSFITAIPTAIIIGLIGVMYHTLDNKLIELGREIRANTVAISDNTKAIENLRTSFDARFKRTELRLDRIEAHLGLEPLADS